MTDLSGPGVRVLLIATAHHENPGLPSVKAVATSSEDLGKVLTERCGVRPDRLRTLLDPPDARTMARAVAEEAQRAETVLLVYFIGHGLIGPDGELYLAASSTDRLTPGMAEHQALSFSSLRQALEASRASSVVVVLDCCFSGRASLGGGAALPMTPAHGMYLMSSAEQLALAPPDAKHTAFTGALIDLLTNGDPRGVQPLTLDAVFDGVFRAMSERQGPLPRRQAGDRSGHLVIAPNPAVPARPEVQEEPEPAPGRCPYLGLDAYGVDDAGVFFGRDRMTERLFAALAEAAEPGPLILVGPSGSGKTSLLDAGLTASLRERGLSGTTSWLPLRLTPGGDPLRRLAAAFGTGPEDADALRDSPDHAVELAERLLAGRPEQRLIVLVDQLEELFTLCRVPSERAAFLRAVTALASRAPVVLALRADFYGRAAAHPELLTALRDRQVLIEPMTPDELRSAIEGPAAAAGLILDDGLADIILHEFGATADRQPTAGALPLLSHVLWATWLRRVGSRLTVAQYRATGGIAEAIKTTAEKAYEELDQQAKEAARLMLPRLVRVGEDSADTAQPVDRSTLLQGLPDRAAGQRALEAFIEARLLTLDHDSARISHEALLRAWPRLAEWVDADREWLRARQQLAADARAWEQAGREPSLLYRGSRLAAVRARAESSSASALEPDPVIAEFVAASWRQERRSVRRARIVMASLLVLVVLAASGGVGSFVFQRRAEQASERDLARYLAAEAESLREEQPGLAKQLSLMAYRMNKEAGRGALLNSRRTPGVINEDEPAYDLAFSGDGRVLAISAGRAVELRFEGGSGRVEPQDVDLIGPVVLSRDGRTLAMVTYGPQTRIRLWDVADPRRPRQVSASDLDQAAYSLALTPDGGILYAGTQAGEIRVWDVADRARPQPLPPLKAHSSRVDSLAASTERDLLASMSVDGRIQIWTAAGSGRPDRVAVLEGAKYRHDTRTNPQPLHRVAFDPHGRLLAAAVAGSTYDKLRLWRLDEPGRPRRVGPEEKGPAGDRPLPGCHDSVDSVAFNPAHQYFVGTCGRSWHVQFYTRTDEPASIKTGASGEGAAATEREAGMVLFDPAHPRRMLQATNRGVRVWDIDNYGQLGAESVIPIEPGGGAHFDHRRAGDKELLALEGSTGNFLIDVTSTRESEVLAATRSPGLLYGAGIALSPDGRLLADVEMFEKVNKKGEKADYVGLRLRTAAKDAPLLATIEELDNGVQGIAFSPTRPILALSDLSGFVKGNRKPPVVRIYDIADPRHPREISQIKAITSQFAFSPDGETLVLVDAPRTDPAQPQANDSDLLQGWDVTDPARPEKVWERNVQGGIGSARIAFRPDGRLLAVYDPAGTLTLWRIANPRSPEAVTRLTLGNDGGPLGFSPDGTLLALVADHGGTGKERIEIWEVSDTGSPKLQSYLPSESSKSISALAFSPDGRFLNTVRSGAGVDTWDMRPESVLRDICAAVGDPITPEQWRRYLPDRPYEPPCGQKVTVR
ncbi:AAA family ATPase [Nonomuraea fastidiosa]|uniref:caspase, EACC1-associated type n=1 Tax=Nonomuraea fastidiosa TaxID=46173 RepID=UPI00366BFA38